LGKEDLENKDLAEVFRGFEQKLTDLDKKVSEIKPTDLTEVNTKIDELKESNETKITDLENRLKKTEDQITENLHEPPHETPFLEAVGTLIDKTEAKTVDEFKEKLETMDEGEIKEIVESMGEQYPPTVVVNMTKYLKGLVGKPFTKRNLSFVTKTLGEKESTEPKEITHVLPGGETIVFGSRAEEEAATDAAAERFLNWGRDHQKKAT